MKIEYSHNNSGGSWWLKDSHWLALEKAGWYVEWGGKYFCHDGSTYSWREKPANKPDVCPKDGDCDGHRRCDSLDEVTAELRMIGSPAQYATKDFSSMAEAVRDWEAATGMDASDEGCNCCGAPHSFSTRDGEGFEYASGDRIVDVLYPNAPKSRRKAAESKR